MIITPKKKDDSLSTDNKVGILIAVLGFIGVVIQSTLGKSGNNS